MHPYTGLESTHPELQLGQILKGMKKEKKKSDGLSEVSKHIERRNVLPTEFGENQ